MMAMLGGTLAVGFGPTPIEAAMASMLEADPTRGGPVVFMRWSREGGKLSLIHI